MKKQHLALAEEIQQLKQQQQQLSAAAANSSSSPSQEQQKQLADKVTADLEKKVHAMLDMALMTLKGEVVKELAAGGGAGVGGDGVDQVEALVLEFHELRDAIRRNTVWLLQTPA